MAVSAADVRSALSLPGPSSGSSVSPSKKPAKESARKREGISRELYSLIGPSAPSLSAQVAKPRLKQKPNLGGGGIVRWQLRKFKNNARNDGLELSHWVKATEDPSAKYPFAEYNTKHNIHSYTDEEYQQYLEDEQWTKPETDYLFQLVREYELRWFVILDRYDFPGGAPRPLEDLKDRYYSVCRKLLRSRPWDGDEASKNALLSSFQFNKDNEVQRKLYLGNLDGRTPEQKAEEEALFIELKKLEQNERRFKREREDLLRRLAGIDSGLPDIVEDEGGPLSLTIDTATKLRKKGSDFDSPSTPSYTPASAAPKQHTRPPIPQQSAKSAAYDAQHCIIRHELSATTPATKAAHTPAYFRTWRIPAPKAAVAPKITQALTELGINATRLVMPTAGNVAKLDELVNETALLLELKKNVDRLDYEISVAKQQLGIDEGGNSGVQDGVMDIDEGEDRAQSVASARSGRGRKQSRRSMSMSSVDTNATGPTKAGVKRQRRS